MDAKTFVNKLKQIAPSYKALKSLDLTDEYIYKIIDTYIVKPKHSVSGFFEDDIIELINSYDVSKIEIGMVTFIDKIVEDDDNYIIGRVDADYLVINKLTNEIEIRDEVNTDYVKLYCAKDSSRLLDTLIISCAFFIECAFNSELWKNKIKTYAKILECSDKAGGEKYLDFFVVLFDYSD